MVRCESLTSPERVSLIEGLLFWKKKCLEGISEGVQGGLFPERNGNVIPCTGAQNGKGMGTSRGKSGVRNLKAETESIRSIEENMGGCVPVAENSHSSRQDKSSAVDTFIELEECAYFIANSLWYWKPVERLKQRSTWHGQSDIVWCCWYVKCYVSEAVKCCWYVTMLVRLSNR